MSDHSHATPTPQAEYFDQKDSGSLSFILAAVGIIGAIISLVWAFLDSQQFAYSWLFGFIVCFTLLAGSLFWILVHHATDAEWSVVIRRVPEQLASLLPVMVIFFIPVLLCAGTLFKWWHLAPGIDASLDKKRGYLNIPFFLIRSGLYFLLLSTVALLLKKNSIGQDSDGSTARTLRMRKISVAGIPIFALSLTFGAFDWLMGLDYHWFSTMWGVYIFAGAAGSSMSMLVLIVTALREKGYLKIVTMEHYHIMGKLMLAFCVFWAYIGFSQYMLIWYANIPEETSYFIRRNIGWWCALSWLLVFGRFFLAFPFLLMQGVKKEPRHLCCVAGWIILMQMLDMYIVVLPMLHADGPRPSLMDLVAPVTIASILGFLFLRGLGKHSLFPTRDPRLPESIRLTN